MGLRLSGAEVVSAISTWGLKQIFKRPAANFPGKIALYIDPQLIAGLAGKLKSGSVVVCGTNGKTTVNNLLADALEAAGMSVICNRTGANLDSGIATALLHGDEADWGVLESDELWLAKVLPQLRSDYVLLLNLFRDQLDRVGEIETIQDSIVSALKASPETVLVYNADDPLCAAIAARVPNKSIAFGIDGSIDLSQDGIAEAQMCQLCEGRLVYGYRQYAQLGLYQCDSCSFSRPPLDFHAHDVKLDEAGLSFAVSTDPVGHARITAAYSGAYMVYNLLAAFTVACLLGCPPETFQKALDAFDPRNGRLQRFQIHGHEVLLNLAKNPTGFNQNLKLIAQGTGPKAVAFFINDKEGDGRDVSWLWDVDFEEAASLGDLKVFAGGIRRNDLQVRLKYAGIASDLVEGAGDVIARTAVLPDEYRLYFIANYTAMPAVREELVTIVEAAEAQTCEESPRKEA